MARGCGGQSGGAGAAFHHHRPVQDRRALHGLLPRAEGAGGAHQGRCRGCADLLAHAVQRPRPWYYCCSRCTTLSVRRRAANVCFASATAVALSAAARCACALHLELRSRLGRCPDGLRPCTRLLAWHTTATTDVAARAVELEEQPVHHEPSCVAPVPRPSPAQISPARVPPQLACGSLAGLASASDHPVGQCSSHTAAAAPSANATPSTPAAVAGDSRPVGPAATAAAAVWHAREGHDAIFAARRGLRCRPCTGSRCPFLEPGDCRCSAHGVRR